jgi:hypothetical protein
VSDPNRVRAGIGVFYVIGIGILVVFLLMLNGLFVRAFVLANLSGVIDFRFIQAIQFVAPLLMILVEFWLYDRMTRRWN